MWTAVILTGIVAAVTIGGLQSIARTAEKIVPAMAIIYCASTLGFLIIFYDKIPAAIIEIMTDAFTPTAATGGFLGATVMVAMRNGLPEEYFPMNLD